jgi:hypothetical protein
MIVQFVADTGVVLVVWIEGPCYGREDRFAPLVLNGVPFNVAGYRDHGQAARCYSRAGRPCHLWTLLRGGLGFGPLGSGILVF